MTLVPSAGDGTERALNKVTLHYTAVQVVRPAQGVAMSNENKLICNAGASLEAWVRMVLFGARSSVVPRARCFGSHEQGRGVQSRG